MDLKIIDDRDMTPALDREIRDLLCTCFPKDVEVYSKTRAWNGYMPAWSVLLEDESRAVAHTGVMHKNIRVGDITIPVAGVFNVCVLPEYRGLGLSVRLMNAVEEEAAKRDRKYGFLFCKSWIEDVYRKSGWNRLEGRSITRVLDDGRAKGMRENIIAMYRRLGPDDFPPGPVHLLGNEW